MISQWITPMRDIQHHINLILGASLHNLQHYRISLKENEIVQDKVKELIQKGMVGASMIPCPILALLTPKKDEKWKICIESQAINKMIVKCMFSIPHLEDILEGSQIFTKIDLSEYHQIYIRL